jgi:hypothetical protein
VNRPADFAAYSVMPKVGYAFPLVAGLCVVDQQIYGTKVDFK